MSYKTTLTRTSFGTVAEPQPSLGIKGKNWENRSPGCPFPVCTGVGRHRHSARQRSGRTTGRQLLNSNPAKAIASTPSGCCAAYIIVRTLRFTTGCGRISLFGSADASPSYKVGLVCFAHRSQSGDTALCCSHPCSVRKGRARRPCFRPALKYMAPVKTEVLHSNKRLLNVHISLIRC